MCLGLAACTQVQADRDGISIRHSAENRVFVDQKALRHCEQFGKRAQRVQRSPEESTYYFRSVVTTYECVRKD